MSIHAPSFLLLYAINETLATSKKIIAEVINKLGCNLVRIGNCELKYGEKMEKNTTQTNNLKISPLRTEKNK